MNRIIGKMLFVTVVAMSLTMSSFADKAIKSAVIINGRTFAKWKIVRKNIEIARFITPETNKLVKEIIVEKSVDLTTIITTVKEVNEQGKLVVISIRTSTLITKKQNQDGSITLVYDDVTVDVLGNVLSTGSTNVTETKVVNGKDSVTKTVANIVVTDKNIDKVTTTIATELVVEIDSEGVVTEQLSESILIKNESGNVVVDESNQTTSVVDNEGNTLSETRQKTTTDGFVNVTEAQVEGSNSESAANIKTVLPTMPGGLNGPKGDGFIGKNVSDDISAVPAFTEGDKRSPIIGDEFGTGINMNYRGQPIF